MDELEEFHRKYIHTYFRYKSGGKWLVAYLESTGRVGQIELRVCDLGIVTEEYPNIHSRIDLTPPKTGYFNHRGYALRLFRTPARQWRRGCCSENHHIVNPLSRILENFSPVYRPPWSLPVAVALYESKFVAHPDRVTEILSNPKIISVAMSPHIAASVNPMEDDHRPLIWFRDNPVGFLDKGRLVIEDATFRQEMYDDFRRQGYNSWIF
jgi:hypothetical protein